LAKAPISVTVVGLGYVGLATAVGLAEIGHRVTGVDKDEERVANLKGGLRLTTSIAEALASAQQVVMIAVQTPSQEDGATDLSFVRDAAREIGGALQNDALVVVRSTVPVGTWRLVKEIVEQAYGRPVAVASNPEFLSEGNAFNAFLNPDRVVVGAQEPAARKLLGELYAPLGVSVVVTTPQTAELAKYAANAFLATEISFINEMADLAEKLEADIREVSAILRLDRRIGPQAYLDAGPGYGGSCLPKDVRSLIQTGRQHGLSLEVVESVDRVNERRLLRILDRARSLAGDLSGKNVTVWGLTFKPGTDDVRESPAMKLVARLLDEGAHVTAHDPLVAELRQSECLKVQLSPNMYESLAGSDLLIIMTAWEAFKTASPQRIKEAMAAPNVVDARNVLDAARMREAGLRYVGLGV